MFKARQILVPIDFSANSWVALETAAELAKLHGSQIDALHVWELPTFVSSGELNAPGLSPALLDAISDRALSSIERFKKEAAAKGITLREARALPGKPYLTIVEQAEQGAYDLIVVGTHGRTGVSRAFLGSVAEQVVRHAASPVLVARSQPA